MTKRLTRYLMTREALRGVVVVMDVRHPLQPMDVSLLEWLQEVQLPTLALLTKADKLSRGQAKNQCLQVQSSALFTGDSASGIYFPASRAMAPRIGPVARRMFVEEEA